MKKQHGFTLVELAVAFVAILFMGSWVWNAVKLASCDFEPSYKCEAIHAVGVFVPPLSIATVWFDDDRE